MRAGLTAYEQGDLDAAKSRLHPELELYAPPEIGNSGTFHGHRGWMAWNAAWLEAWDEFRQELLSIEPFGETHVLARVHQRARGRGSGVEVDREATFVFDVRDGLATYMALFFDHHSAVELARSREAEGSD